MNNMNSLFVAWRPPMPDQTGWRPVGRLEHDQGLFRFWYTQGARKPGFRPFAGMTNLTGFTNRTSCFRYLPTGYSPSRDRNMKRTLRWSGFEKRRSARPYRGTWELPKAFVRPMLSKCFRAHRPMPRVATSTSSSCTAFAGCRTRPLNGLIGSSRPNRSRSCSTYRMNTIRTPWPFAQDPDSIPDRLRASLSGPRCLAVGE